LLEVLSLLVARPWLTAGATAAALYRKIEKVTPTLLCDELDARFGGDKERAEALRGVLNSGFNRKGVHSVCFGQGAAMTVLDFKTFCPKALASIGRPPDTIIDRSIVIELRRKLAGRETAQFRQRRVEALAEPLRTDLETWAAETLSS
jgi:hypothetical protein